MYKHKTKDFPRSRSGVRRHKYDEHRNSHWFQEHERVESSQGKLS